MKRSEDNYTFLTQGPIHRVIGTMAGPTIISMMVTSLYNIADTFYVGLINTQATAAVGIVFSVMFIIQAVSFFFGNGSGNYISRELGAQRHANAEKMASTGFFYAIMGGFVILIVGESLLTRISLLLGSTPTILPYTERYLGVILLGAPFVTGSLTMNNQMRFQGNASYAMWGIVSGTILNVILAPILIFVFHLGITGAGISTVIGQATSFFILYQMTKKGGSLRLHFRNISFSNVYIKEILAGGTPSLSRQGLSSLATIMLNVGAGPYGDAAIAGMTIVNRLTMFLMAMVIGFGQGFQPFCGFNYGAHLYDRVKSGYWFSIKVTTAFLLVCSITGWIFSGGIIDIFRHDPAVIAVGTVALRWQLCTLPFGGLLMISNMFTQTVRKTMRANILAASRSGLFFIPLIIILPRYFGLLGVEMCQAISDLCAVSITIPIMFTVFREMK